MPSALRQFQRSRPSVQVEVRALASEKQVQALLRGDIGVGLVHRVTDHPGVVSENLFDEPFILALPSRHRLTALGAIRPKDLVGEVWVGLSRALHPAAYASFARIGRAAGFVPEVRHETGDRATALALVESGLGIALLPDERAPRSHSRRHLPRSPWLTISTGVALIRRPAPSAAEKHLPALAIAAARTQGPLRGR